MMPPDRDTVPFTDDDDIVFADESGSEKDTLSVHSSHIEEARALSEVTWKIMIVDDEEEVHSVTRFALSNYSFHGKKLEFISAYSAEEARELLQKHPSTTILLLDVVMETDDAGLRLIEYIRNVLSNSFVRIIIRTGQPGHAPENEVIVQYDINDYKNKAELTDQRLFTVITSCIRSYSHLITIETYRQNLERQLAYQVTLTNAYERFVPHEFLQSLKKDSIVDVLLGDQTQQEMTVMFADIRSFTQLSEKMTPKETFSFINSYLQLMEPVIIAHQGFIDKYIGDGIMALFAGSANGAVNAAIAMLGALTGYNRSRQSEGHEPIQIGIGLNSGPLMLGTVGSDHRMDGTVVSDTVNTASRIEELTKVYGLTLLIGQETYARLEDLTPYKIRTFDHVSVRGKAQQVTVYEVFNADPPDVIALKMQTLHSFEQGLIHYHRREFAEAQMCLKSVLQINPADKAAQVYMQRCEQILRTLAQ
jgi:adenylate cyclase